MGEVVHGWDDRIAESEKQNPPENRPKHKKVPLPSDSDPDFAYGVPTRQLDVKADPFARSNAIIAARVAQQERKQKKQSQEPSPKRRTDAPRPTAASLGHARPPPPEPRAADSFKMKRFANVEHGKVDTGLRK
jgi:hypothetical protein